jgi:hypothetical protein
MRHTPSTPSVVNHTSMTGPKTLPTAPVPRRCTKNSATRMPTAIGMTKSWSLGSTTPSPSTALSTEMAGVITPSP